MADEERVLAEMRSVRREVVELSKKLDTIIKVLKRIGDNTRPKRF